MLEDIGKGNGVGVEEVSKAPAEGRYQGSSWFVGRNGSAFVQESTEDFSCSGCRAE